MNNPFPHCEILYTNQAPGTLRCSEIIFPDVEIKGKTKSDLFSQIREVAIRQFSIAERQPEKYNHYLVYYKEPAKVGGTWRTTYSLVSAPNSIFTFEQLSEVI